jgi:hypothetical protein
MVRADDSRVRFVWVAAAALATGAMFGYFVSRAIPLPGMADHQGDWFGSIGVFAGLFEIGLVGLAAFALRDRVVRRQLQRRARRRTRVVAPAMSILGLFGLQPAMALAHGGEEMTPEEMAAAEMGHDPGSMNHDAMAAHDPLLGGTELGIIFALALGFVAWAGFALRARVARSPHPVRSRRAAPSRSSRARPRPRHAPTLSAEPGPVSAMASEPETKLLATIPRGRPTSQPGGVSPA